MSTYSNLKFELITTGEQSGQWGNTTNTNIGTAIEQAIVGMATLTSADFPSNVATLTLTDANTAQNARALCLNIASGALAAAGTLNVPAIQKPYLIINGSSFAVTVKVSGQTGVSVPAGKRTVVYNNATDVGNQIDYLSTLALGTALPITSGGTGSTSTTFVNLASNVTGTLPIANGGTGSTSTTFVNLTTNVTGTLPVANGGTGQTTYTDGQLLIGNSTGNTLTKATLTAGSNVTITNSAGGITIASSNPGGTVTGVTATSPVASSGGAAPVISLSAAYGDTLNPYGVKTANYVLAGPTTGVAAAPTFRALVSGDIPNNAANTSGTAAGLSATLAVASGGTGVTTSTGSGSVVLSTSPTLVTPALGTPSSGSLINCTFPTLNQNTTGTAAGLSSTLAIASGGTGQTTAAAAITALTGTQTNGQYLRSNGTNAVLAAILAADVPTLNQNTTGTAAGLSSTLAIASGGTGGTTAASARTNLGATTIGGNMYTLANPSAITFPRFNADNTVSALDAASFRTAIGAGTGGGSVTSVSGTGTVNGLTLTGTVTTTGDLTLGGTLSSIDNSALTNSSITIGGTAISLGGSTSTITNDLSISGLTVGKGSGSVSTNTAVGSSTLSSANSFTTNTTAFGYRALRLITGGNLNNTAVGSNAGAALVSGSNNTFVGKDAGDATTSSGSSTAVGANALSGVCDSNNTAVGADALAAATGSSNTAIGQNAGNQLSTGANNQFFGQNSGSQITTGSSNVVLGSYTGNDSYTGLDIRTLSSYLVLSAGFTFGSSPVRMWFNDTGKAYLPYIGSGAGTNALKWNSTTKEVTYDTSSARYKDNIRNSIYGLSHVMQMRSAQFEYKDTGRSDVGLIAEELDLIVPELVAKDEDDKPNAVSYDRMVSVLVKAIQEQQTIIDSLKARLDAANL